MEIDIFSLFPDYFSSPLQTSILGRAIRKNILNVRCRNIRDFGLGKWKQVDDAPFYGSGMLLKAEPIVQAIRSVRNSFSRVVYLSPQGSLFSSEKAKELAQYPHLIFVCGHYEGVDERALSEVDEEISIGDYVLTNGAIAALVMIDAISRFIPEVLGNEESAFTDSLENGLLEGPQYTRPRVFEEQSVPKVLLSGDHSAISQWRLNESLKRTKKRRPDLYFRYIVNQNDPQTFVTDADHNEDAAVSVLLKVREVNRSKLFYSKVFQHVSIKDNSVFFPGKISLLLHLSESNESIVCNTFALRMNGMHSFLRVVRKWEKWGGRLDKASASTGLVTAFDLDGHMWQIVDN